MSMKKKENEELKEEIKNEEVTSDVAEENCKCDCNFDECGCGCDECFEDDFTPVHKIFSGANMFQIFAKFIAIVVLILGAWNYIAYIIENPIYIQQAKISGLVTEFISSILLIPTLLYGIGITVNLVNRIKEYFID